MKRERTNVTEREETVVHEERRIAGVKLDTNALSPQMPRTDNGHFSYN